MSKERQGNPPDDDSEKVGYGKPPKHSRFKKGVSGNSKGRPPGAKNKPPATDDLLTLLREEGSRVVKVTQNGKTEKIQTLRLITRRLLTAAASGDARAQKIVMSVQSGLEERKLDRNSAALSAAFEYKQFCQKRIAEAKKAGAPPPRFSPHPDAFEIDFDKEEVRCLELDPVGSEYIELSMDLLAYTQSDLSAAIKNGCEPEDLSLFLDDLRSTLSQIIKLTQSLDLPWCTDRSRPPDMKRLAELHNKLSPKNTRTKPSKKARAQ